MIQNISRSIYERKDAKDLEIERLIEENEVKTIVDLMFFLKNENLNMLILLNL